MFKSYHAKATWQSKKDVVFRKVEVQSTYHYLTPNLLRKGYRT